MKIRIPLSEALEAKITIQKSDGTSQRVAQIAPEELDALLSSLSQQRPTITGQTWAEATEDLPDEPDYTTLIDTIKETGGSVEINGVKIQRCNEFGQTEDVQKRSLSNHVITIKPGGVTVGPINDEESEWNPSSMGVKPTQEQLNRLAQKFYSASGLSLSAFDKPHIIQGLAAVFEMEIE